MVDPIVSGSAVLGAAKSAKQVSGEVQALLKKLEASRPDLKSLRIDYPTQTSKMRIRLSIPRSWVNAFSKVEIPIPTGYQIGEVMDSGFNSVPIKWDEKPGRWIAPKNAFQKGEAYLVSLSGSVSESLLSEFVELRCPENPTKRAAHDKYWLHSALRDPGALESIYTDLDIERVGVKVGVGVERTFSTAVPKEAERLLQAKQEFNEAMRQRRRNLRHVQANLYEAERLAGKITVNRIYDLVTKLASRESMEGFIEVSDRFDVGGVNPLRGLSLFPTAVDVSVNTDLSLRDPVAKGDLTFLKRAFRDDVKGRLEEAVEAPEK